MSDKISDPKNFDYSAYDKEVKGQLIWYAGEIRRHGKAHIESGLAAGKMLAKARELCGETPFKTWTERECGFSVRTAYNYISAWQEFGDCATVAHIELSAMYILASNKVAKKAALAMANKGKTVTQEIAKKLLAKNKPAKKSEPAGKPEDTTREGTADGVTDDQDPLSDTGEDAKTGTEPEDSTTEPPRNGTEKPVDSSPDEPPTDKCPVCAGTKWEQSDEGWECSKCWHPFGESPGGPDDERVATQIRKTVKTIEALVRSFDDLQHICPNDRHENVIVTCKVLMEAAKEWK